VTRRVLRGADDGLGEVLCFGVDDHRVRVRPIQG
jgi:hypothetical protein